MPFNKKMLNAARIIGTNIAIAFVYTIPDIISTIYKTKKSQAYTSQNPHKIDFTRPWYPPV